MALRLRDKLILITGGAILLTTALNTYWNILAFVRTYKETVVEKVFFQLQPLEKTVNDIVELGLGLGELEGIDRECRSMVASIPYARYCLVMDNEGKVYCHSSPEKAGVVYRDAVTLKSLASHRRQAQFYTSDSGERVYDFSLPIKKPTGERIGLIRLGVQSGIVDRQVSRLISQAATTGAVSVFLASIVVLVLCKYGILNSIQQLVQGIARFGRGELDSRVELTRRDEIGELASAFNRMTEEIRHTTTSIDSLNNEIAERKRAEERQADLVRQLEKTNQELKDFAHIVSHDLKAPLRGVKVLVDWISKDYSDKLDAEGKQQMSLLVNRVDRMHNLIDGILRYSRTGGAEEEKVAVHLGELIPEIVDMISPPENVAITVEGLLPTIQAETARITQVFQNLLSNAVKYMDKPQGRIRIGCVEEDGFWRFSVSDNGPGIEEKHFEKIFKLFQTLTSRDAYESTGVGLAIVKKIVEMYGGRIWVESQLGEGSTFLFTWPRSHEDAANEKPKVNIAR